MHTLCSNTKLKNEYLLIMWCLWCCRTTRLATFPDYLIVQMKKFTLGDDWVPKKLGKVVFPSWCLWLMPWHMLIVQHSIYVFLTRKNHLYFMTLSPSPRVTNAITFKLFFINTQQPWYNATRYNAISDTMLIFLGSQIIFKKYLWDSVEVKFTYFCPNHNWKYWIYINMAAF